MLASTLHIGIKDAQIPWYENDIKVHPQARELLESYSRIPPIEVDQHVAEMRQNIWAVFPWPCIGGLGFLDFNLSERDTYTYILKLLKTSPAAKFLDIGCCVGQDLRKLVWDGARSEQLVGLELEQGFIDAGYDLFNDRSTLKTEFVVADILDGNNVKLNAMDGTFDAIHIGLVLQIFDGDEQMAFIINAIKKLKGERGLITGHCLGHKTGAVGLAVSSKGKKWHTWESWVAMWEIIGQRVNRVIEVNGHVEEWKGFGDEKEKSDWIPEQWTRIIFDVWVK